jgi:multimeric flavodoxin WrbA
MKIAMINGSPKAKDSNSAILQGALEKLISDKAEITYYKIGTQAFSQEGYEELLQHDIWVFAFPLYCDAIPSNIFSMMVGFDEFIKNQKSKNICVYLLMNNGFYEGDQTAIAFEITKNWCKRTGLRFCGGMGHGAGEMLPYIKNIPMGHGPLKNMGHALQTVAESIMSLKEAPNLFISPNFPRFMWRFMAINSFWKQQARKNNLSGKDMLNRMG